MGNITYKINDYSKEYLQKHKFRYNSYLSDYGEEIYTYKFPLITYKSTTTIECEISVSTTTGVVNINVYNSGTRDLYASYYNREFGACEIIKSIDVKIEKKLNELGITKL
ncbi:MAG: hypothetical protein NC489_42555 [Ruminococcus flavefaciens]|nr:hypothetical protein [Ruminococcus flavefaciens]